jgi:serine/threonine protein kinase
VGPADDEVTAILDPLLLRARGRIGSTLRGKWRLDALLGIGGMAAVYAGTHRNGMRAAVKVLHPEMMINAEVRTRFLREGYVANSIDHQAAVKVLDDDVAEDGSLFLVTELLDGETLEDRRIRLGGQMREDDVLSVIDPLLEMLAIAHEKGVVHRDLKPENLFLTRSGQLKVLDFGIAVLRSLSTVSTATKQGTSMGTAAFMSPEQARGLWAEVDALSDLWATGATMFCLLTGSLVHEGRTTNEVLLNAMTAAARPIASVMPDLSPAVAIVVDRALAFSREQRWRDARRMQDAIRRAYHDRRGTPITTAPKLLVPDSVPNRTLPGSSRSGGPALRLTTAGPVANTAGNRLSIGDPRTLALALGAGAVWLVVIIAGIVAFVGHDRAPPVRTAASVSASGPAASASSLSQSKALTHSPEPAIPSVSISLEPPPSTTVPELAVTDLPLSKPYLPSLTLKPAPSASVAAARPVESAAATAMTAARDAEAAASPVSSATGAKAGCEPPYVIDSATGHIRWKPECFEQK